MRHEAELCTITCLSPALCPERQEGSLAHTGSSLLRHVTVTPLGTTQNPELAGTFEISQSSLSFYSWEWTQGSRGCPRSPGLAGSSENSGKNERM